MSNVLTRTELNGRLIDLEKTFTDKKDAITERAKQKAYEMVSAMLIRDGGLNIEEIRSFAEYKAQAQTVDECRQNLITFRVQLMREFSE